MFPRCLVSGRIHQSGNSFCRLVTLAAKRQFHVSVRRNVVKPFLLSDPGEGIKEVQIIQWFVEPGARVEQFDKIVEVQTDKASNEITSRFDGIIKKLHYNQDDVVQVGQALLDIDVQGEIAPEDEEVFSAEPQQAGSSDKPQQPQKAVESYSEDANQVTRTAIQESTSTMGRHSTLATPAVRGLLKELDVQITDVRGTGRDGRVTKEDVHAHVAARKAGSDTTSAPPQPSPGRPAPSTDEAQVETPIALTPIQRQMFKTMTQSLTIPHFLYTDEVDVSALSALRQRLNNNNNKNAPPTNPKLSYLHFIIKAVSLALEDFPLLNARIETPPSPSPPTSPTPPPPRLIHRRNQNIGLAIATPSGLLVPNIKNTATHSITSLATECTRLQHLAHTAQLTARDLTGGTLTVSNIGSIGGTYVSPVIVPGEVAILGLGRARTVPAFDKDGGGVWGRKEVMNFSWSADHRVVDGATMARMAERVRGFVEEPGEMLARLS